MVSIGNEYVRLFHKNRMRNWELTNVFLWKPITDDLRIELNEIFHAAKGP
jgi:hypothetical protein